MTIFVGGGNGGAYRVTSTVTAKISSGATGDVLPLTPPSGMLGLLRHLRSGATESGCSLEVDGNTLKSGSSLSSIVTNSSDGSFIVSIGFGATGASGGATHTSGNCFPGLFFDTNLTVSKDAGSTVNDIYYSVDYIEFI